MNDVFLEDGNNYFVSFIDDMSKFFFAYLMKAKDKSFNKFFIYKTKVKNQLERKIKIKIMRSNRECDYSSNKLIQYCDNGIEKEETPPYSPKSNGVA